MFAVLAALSGMEVLVGTGMIETSGPMNDAFGWSASAVPIVKPRDACIRARTGRGTIRDIEYNI